MTNGESFGRNIWDRLQISSLHLYEIGLSLCHWLTASVENGNLINSVVESTYVYISIFICISFYNYFRVIEILERMAMYKFKDNRNNIIFLFTSLSSPSFTYLCKGLHLIICQLNPHRQKIKTVISYFKYRHEHFK